MGSLLSIKPIIEIRDGVVEAESRQRTRTRSLEYLATKVKEAGPLQGLCVAHAAAPDLDVLLEMLAGHLSPERKSSSATSARSSGPTPGPDASASATGSLDRSDG